VRQTGILGLVQSLARRGRNYISTTRLRLLPICSADFLLRHDEHYLQTLLEPQLLIFCRLETGPNFGIVVDPELYTRQSNHSSIAGFNRTGTMKHGYGGILRCSFWAAQKVPSALPGLNRRVLR